jgi:glycosyltransferase involved in cell wall biosynthesis
VSAVSPLPATVVLPAYNDQNNLDACLEALARQDYSLDRFEVIVVDNGSSPDLRLRNFPGLNSSLLHCARPGSYAARNAGLRAARGKVLAFLDVDCIPDRKWLSSGLEMMNELPGKTVVGGEVVFQPGQNPGATELFQQIRIRGQRYNIQQERFSITGNLIVRSKDIAAIGEFNEDLLSGGDKEWCWRAIEKGFDLQFNCHSIVTTKYRDSITAAITQTRRITGGKYYLQNRLKARMPVSGGSVRHSSGWNRSFLHLLDQHNLSLPDQLRVVSVAVVLKVVELIEMLRLRAGFSAERR